MKAGEADVGMKRRGSQLRKQNMMKLSTRGLKRGGGGCVGRRKRTFGWQREDVSYRYARRLGGWGDAFGVQCLAGVRVLFVSDPREIYFLFLFFGAPFPVCTSTVGL